MKKEQFQDGLAKRYPMLFAESDVDRETLTSLSQKEYTQVQLYPPASANELEFHILKFYCFSSALVYNALKVNHFEISCKEVIYFFNFDGLH